MLKCLTSFYQNAYDKPFRIILPAKKDWFRWFMKMLLLQQRAVQESQKANILLAEERDMPLMRRVR
jgi:hypothetical protein